VAVPSVLFSAASEQGPLRPSSLRRSKVEKRKRTGSSRNPCSCFEKIHAAERLSVAWCTSLGWSGCNCQAPEAPLLSVNLVALQAVTLHAWEDAYVVQEPCIRETWVRSGI